MEILENTLLWIGFICELLIVLTVLFGGSGLIILGILIHHEGHDGSAVIFVTLGAFWQGLIVMAWLAS